MKAKLVLCLLVISGGLMACTIAVNQQGNSSTSNNPANLSAVPPQSNTGNAKPAESTPNTSENAGAKEASDQSSSACHRLTRDDYLLDKKQTFAIDFPPFEKSCFVVFHDPEFDDPPLNSQYFIYRDGKEIYTFPDQFNGSNVGCWVTAVAFEDLNDDGLKDVAITGKCSAKSSPYSENMAYINTGRDFKTNPRTNEEMMDFTKIGQVKDYVRKHVSEFTK